MKKFSFALALFLSFCFIGPVHAEEKINYFDSTVYVNEDGSLEIIERISVDAENININHGIYRDIPTAYKDNFGHKYNVDFSLTSVVQDGEEQDYHTEKKNNGTRIYIGKSDEYVSQGEHIYELQYTVHHVLGFFQNHDELYWNVTGDGWEFPIEKASAWVVLPSSVPENSLQLQAFTGEKGSTEAMYTVETYKQNGSTGPLFETTRLLNPGEGFTIVTGWEPGYVHRPTPEETLMRFLGDNMTILFGVVGVFVLFFYYLYAWIRFGRDPEKNTIIAQYDAPKDMSPAKIRYLMNMGFDDEVFTSQLIDMASRGLMTINQDKNKYIFTLVENTHTSLLHEDDLILDHLFGKRGGARRASVTVDTKSSRDTTGDVIIRGTKKVLTKFLEKEMNKRFFHLNRKYIWKGLAFSVLVLIITGNGDVTTLFPIIWLSIWTSGVVVLVSQAVKIWKPFIHSEKKSFTQLSTALGASAFASIFIAAEVVAIIIFFAELTLSFLFITSLLAVINIIFYNILPSLTPEGRKLMDYLEGFKWFLSVTEKERLHFFHPPDKTPELFQKYLSYAFALGVGQQWAEQFTAVFAAEKNKGEQPSWYHSTALLNNWSPISLVNSISNASTSISAASQPPSSSSGFSGGSSGGGGGGGGGGGW